VHAASQHSREQRDEHGRSYAGDRHAKRLRGARHPARCRLLWRHYAASREVSGRRDVGSNARGEGGASTGLALPRYPARNAQLL
jgi:hypothetical protein